MEKVYKVNNIFNENGKTLNELISTFLVSFQDKELNIHQNHDQKTTSLVSNL